MPSEFHKSWHLCFFFCFLFVLNSIYPPHVLLHDQQGKVRWQNTVQWRSRCRPCQKKERKKKKSGRTPSEEFTSESALSCFVNPPPLRSLTNTHVLDLVRGEVTAEARGSAAQSVRLISNQPAPHRASSTDHFRSHPPKVVQSSKKQV